MMNRIKETLKMNLTRILLFAVVISFGFTLVLSTNAKYLSYLNSHTHAQAGEFYFESTYLTDDHVTYTVNTWNRTEYKVLLQFMNFKNSLLYNLESQGFYYQVEANLYTDESYSEINSNYNVTFSLSEGIEVKEFNGKKYFYFPQGKQDVFSKDGRIQGVEVKVSLKEGDGFEKVETRQYLKITAKTLSSEDLFYYNKTQGGEFKTSEYPVFERELSATFVLEYNPNVEIRTELKQSQSSSEVDYRITYAENIGISEAKVKVYFNKEKLEIDRTLGYELFEDPDKPGFYYLQTEVYATGMRNIIFFKTKTSDTIEDETDVFSVLLPND